MFLVRFRCPLNINHNGICHLCWCLSRCTLPCPPHRSLSHPLAWELIISLCLCCYFGPWGQAGLALWVSIFEGGWQGWLPLSPLPHFYLPLTTLSEQLGWVKLETGCTQTYLAEGRCTGASHSCLVTATDTRKPEESPGRSLFVFFFKNIKDSIDPVGWITLITSPSGSWMIHVDI